MNLLYVSSLALDSGPSPCAIRLAVWSIAALSGLLPAATISTTAMTAARKWIGYNVLDSPMRDE